MKVESFLTRALKIAILFLIVLPSPERCFGWEMTYAREFGDLSRQMNLTADGGSVLTGGTETTYNTGDFRVLVMKNSASGKIQWQKTFGSGIGESVVQTKDGGFIVASTTGDGDIGILSLSKAGNLKWYKKFQRPNSPDAALEIRPSRSGGYILIGYTGFINTNSDWWVLRLDANGRVRWHFNYGGPFFDFPSAVQETPDGGWIVVGYIKLTQNGNNRCWVVKLAPSGTIEWQTAFGGNRDTYGTGIQLTEDGGYAVAGFYFRGFTTDAYVAKLDFGGRIRWVKSYGGDEYEQITSFQSNGNGGFLMAGDTGSYIRGRQGNAWILSLDQRGRILWQNSYGNEDGSIIISARALNKDSLVALGDIRTTTTGQDWWLLKLNRNGQIGSSCDLQQVSTSDAVPILFKQVTTKRKAVHKKMVPRRIKVRIGLNDATANPVCSAAAAHAAMIR
jgi:hypothetical protein